MESCYACDRRATSREHVPPKCFFPKKKDVTGGANYRVNLITVPSCPNHNLSKSNDDEYILVVVLSYFKNNPVAQAHFSKQMMRAFHRRPSKLALISTGYPARVDGLPSWAPIADMERINRTFSLIAKAIYFHHFGEKWDEEIHVISPAFIKVDGKHREINFLIQQIDHSAIELFENKPRFGANQEVFYYQLYCDEESQNLLMRMVFYEGFAVIAYAATITCDKESEA